MRKVTIVLEGGGDIGGKLALALASQERLAPLRYFARRDRGLQVEALASKDDAGARGRWVRACKKLGLAVAPAPWEGAKSKSEAKRVAVLSGESPEVIQ